MGGILSSLFGGESAAAGSEDHPGINSFHSEDRWQLHFNSFKESSQLMVVDFAASWCGPCKFMEPAVQDMAARFTDVCFAKIDVDELKDVAREFAVEAMPTFVLLKRGKVIDRVIGAKKQELEMKIEKHRA